VKITVFYNVTPCSLVNGCHRFRETYSPHRQKQREYDLFKSAGFRITQLEFKSGYDNVACVFSATMIMMMVVKMLLRMVNMTLVKMVRIMVTAEWYLSQDNWCCG
jgi:hypothetical protein